jgi:hypothetical protein
MVDFSSFLPVIGSAFVDWLKLFAAPLKNFDMLWIIIPIWASWLFAEFFQEKKGTSFGNAISNGVVMMFVGVDWVRYIIRQINAGLVSLDAASFIKLAIAAFIIIFGLSIIFLGVKAKTVVRAIGRVREVSYLMLMFTPIVYGVVDFSLRIFITIMAFLPVFYLLIEILDRLTPTPRTYEVEEEEKDLGKGLKGLGKGAGMGDLNIPTGLGSDFGQDVFGSQFQSNFPNQPFARQPQQPQQQKGKKLF